MVVNILLPLILGLLPSLAWLIFYLREDKQKPEPKQFRRAKTYINFKYIHDQRTDQNGNESQAEAEQQAFEKLVEAAPDGGEIERIAHGVILP